MRHHVARLGAIALAIGLVCLPAPPAAANETDQYTLPLDREFADLGDYLDLVHYRVLERLVERTNEQIAEALAIKHEHLRRRRLEQLQSPRRIADVVRLEFKPGFFEQWDIEDAVTSGRARRGYSGQITLYRTWNWIYTYTHLPFDPRRIPLLYRSGTLKAYGVYFGTDKLAHFHDLGHIYYKDYLFERERGRSHDEAVAIVVRRFSRGLISEGSFIGILGTGVHSNADLAANYAGMKFYMNLTEPVRLGDRVLPPMLVRRGPFWRLNFHVRPESGFFGAFISDHLNEALNPSHYDWGVRKMVRWRMKKLADRIVTFYVERDGRPADPAYFENLARSLATYYGEDYGHPGRFDGLLTIGNTCLPLVAEEADQDRLATTP